MPKRGNLVVKSENVLKASTTTMRKSSTAAAFVSRSSKISRRYLFNNIIPFPLRFPLFYHIPPFYHIPEDDPFGIVLWKASR